MNPNYSEMTFALKKRRQYFEKANLAYNRGWGAVAQYYSDCVIIIKYFAL